ncbi:MAG: hypothetical protein PF569_08075 [Candidatus Woesearchaeota archaeon]|jgi:hypothetical protein|nr:hypothetical protein [Candidatus Woesearchaeota archaeon]
MKKVFSLILLSIMLLSGCSQVDTQISEENSNTQEVKDNLSQIKEVKEINFTEIKEKELSLIKSQINISGIKLWDVYRQYNLKCSLLDSPYVSATEEDIKECDELLEELEEKKQSHDILESKKQIIETNTMNIIKHSNNLVTELSFSFNLLNINPTLLRFELLEKVDLSIFIKQDNYECLFVKGSFEPGMQMIENKNNCYINSSSPTKILIEQNNNIKLMSILSDSDFINTYTDKLITGVTFPDGDDYNVTWEIESTIENSGNKPYYVKGLRTWVSKRDVNISYKLPEAVDKDTVSGKLLEKKFEIQDLKLEPGQIIKDSLAFNYTDIPSPDSWFDYEYYYEMK